MFNENIRSEIEQDPSERVEGIQVIPLKQERKVMRLKPRKEVILHVDCELICIDGIAEIINPLPGTINLIDDIDNKNNKIKRYYVDGIIFGIRAEARPVKFAIRRPQRWK